MQARPIRSQLYLPVLRFGITDEDWGLVILASITGYAVPFVLGMEINHIPVELIGWVVMMGASILTLTIIRKKNRSGWLKHTMQSRLRGKRSRRYFPNEASADWLNLK
jgi:hypothetical protein